MKQTQEEIKFSQITTATNILSYALFTQSTVTYLKFLKGFVFHSVFGQSRVK
jgi:hypothetical protein